MLTNYCNYLIIGSGIIGLNIALGLAKKYPQAKIIIIEKEANIGMHSSGRNSGVLHTGFYYQPDSLKAKFTYQGNLAMTKYCQENNLMINKCGKVVVAQNDTELETLFELKKRGELNGSNIQLVDEQQLKDIEPYAKTYKYALYSPNTSTIDPQIVLQSLLKDAYDNNIIVKFNEAYEHKLDTNKIITNNQSVIEAEKIINVAGLYADKIAKDFGHAKNYSILPFKGIYLEYSGNTPLIKTNIYPVPNIKNPFLGVHFTITAHGKIKIGPTAIPALWRENYSGLDNFSLPELVDIIGKETYLLITNKFNFRNLALSEIKKYSKKHLVSLASNLVKNINHQDFNKWGRAGIRAQLINNDTSQLVQDFVIEHDKISLHVLNAVSPGFTCSMPFASWIINKYL
jgi:L-2-hydroxyglutarate oxidase